MINRQISERRLILAGTPSSKRLFFTLLALFIFTQTITKASLGAAPGEEVIWEIMAPGGSEMNLTEERMAYFATKAGPVVVTSLKLQLWFAAGEVVYEKAKGVFSAREEVVYESGAEGSTEWRALAEEMVYSSTTGELLFPVGGQFFRKEDGQEIAFTAGRLMAELDPSPQGATSSMDGSSGVRWFRAEEGFECQGKGWRLTGQTAKGDLQEGVFQADGEVNLEYEDITGRADRLLFNEKEKVVLLTGDPVVFRGPDRIEGAELLFHLETGKITIRGAVKARLYR